MKEERLDTLIENVVAMAILNVILATFKQNGISPCKEMRLALRVLDRWLEHFTSIEELARFGKMENIEVELDAIRALLNQ